MCTTILVAWSCEGLSVWPNSHNTRLSNKTAGNKEWLYEDYAGARGMNKKNGSAIYCSVTGSYIFCR